MINEKLFVSLSQYPGVTGKTYYTKFFQKYNLDYIYEPLGTDCLDKSIHESLDRGVSGISISMPFKTEVIKYLDILDKSVLDYDLCNTILVQNNKLVGYNSDLYGALHVKNYIKSTDSITILGNGAMSKMFQNLLPNYNITVCARSLENWNKRTTPADVIINCTALGTSSEDSPFVTLPQCKLVIDLAIKSNQLKNQCQTSLVKYIPGIDFYKYQFINQFKIYTGLNLHAEEFDTI